MNDKVLIVKQGIQGTKGDQGIQGVQGIQGIQGVQGDAGTGMPVKYATGTADAIEADYIPNLTLTDGMICVFISSGENTVVDPTFDPDSLGADTIVKDGGSPLVLGDIGPLGTPHTLVYNLVQTRWELQNPNRLVTGPASSTDNSVSIYDTTTGKKLKDSGLALQIDNVNIRAGFGVFPTHQIHVELTASNNIFIDGRTNPRLITLGAERHEHTAGIAGTRAIHIDIDSAGYDDTSAIVIRQDLLNSSAIIRPKGINFHADVTGATNAHLNFLECSITGTLDASMKVDAVDVWHGMGVIDHHSGSTSAADTVFKYDDSLTTYTDITTEAGSDSSDVSVFDEINDYLYFGNTTQFGAIEVILATAAGSPGIKPEFEYSKGASVWETLSISDDSNGYRENGNIFYTKPGDWAVDTVNAIANKYWVRIKRTSNCTAPTEDTMKIIADTSFGWDKNADININSLTALSTISGSNLSGTNTGDQTITLTGDITGSGTGSFATTIAANAVLESNLSAAVQTKLNNTAPSKFDSTVPPDADDDSAGTGGNGIFTNGSVMIDIVGNEAYRCVDDSVGAAIWINTTLTTSELGTMAVQNANAVTISGGTISGITDIAVADGGTGASDISGAQTNLNLVPGTDVQIENISLTSIAGLTTAANKMIYTTAPNTYAVIDLTAAGRALLDDANATAQRTTLGLVIGTDVSSQEIEQNSKSAAYTLILSDSGKHILHPSADTTARIFTIPANSSVAYPIGTALTFVNQDSAGEITIAITTDTMRLAGEGTIGSRILAENGVATALKLTATEWIISGTGLT